LSGGTHFSKKKTNPKNVLYVCSWLQSTSARPLPSVSQNPPNRKNKKKKRKDLEEEENGTILVFELENWVSSNSYHLYNEKALDLLVGV
jgi:hypothetical protein